MCKTYRKMQAAPAESDLRASANTDGRPFERPGSSYLDRPSITLPGLFCTYRWRMVLTYFLFNLENILRLAQPSVLGMAINGLLAASHVGLVIFVGLHFVHMLVGCLRRMYDTRVFTGIYADIASRIVLEQRRHQIDVSQVVARSGLSREFVAFFERDVPLLLHAAYSVIGALVVLSWYDVLLAPVCLCMVVPTYLINWAYGQKSLRLNNRLNNQLEREVKVIQRSKAEEVHGHYSELGYWRVKLSDWESFNFGAMELLVLVLMAVSLIPILRDTWSRSMYVQTSGASFFRSFTRSIASRKAFIVHGSPRMFTKT